MIPAVAYQGGKTRLAPALVDHWWPVASRFYDICCGSGAVSIEMWKRGTDPTGIAMWDAGPWGLFWQQIGDGTFPFDTLTEYVRSVPADRELIHGWVNELAGQPAQVDTSVVFLLLQSGAFGSKAIWIEDDRWANTTFRDVWLPTETSSRQSPVNPMMPMPDTLRRRVHQIMENMRGVEGHCGDATTLEVEPESVVYIDPPYRGTTGYGHDIDVDAFHERISRTATCYVSEARPVGPNAVEITLPSGKGGITGNRKAAHQEWLSW